MAQVNHVSIIKETIRIKGNQSHNEIKLRENNSKTLMINPRQTQGSIMQQVLYLDVNCFNQVLIARLGFVIACGYIY